MTSRNITPLVLVISLFSLCIQIFPDSDSLIQMVFEETVQHVDCYCVIFIVDVSYLYKSMFFMWNTNYWHPCVYILC